MATQFAGGTYINYTYTSDGTINSMITAMQTQLTNAGWSMVTSVAGNVLMKTATTPMGLNDCFRFKNNSATSMTVSLQNAAGTLVGGNSTSAGCFITPVSGATFKIIATQYWFLIVALGVYSYKSFVYGGVLYLPSFMTNCYEAGLLMGNCYNDTGGNNGNNQWRSNFGWSQNVVTNYQMTTNNLMQDNASNLLNCSNCFQCSPALASAYFVNLGYGIQNNYYYVQQWTNGDVLTIDPLMAWDVYSAYGNPQVRGQLYDATIISQGFVGDTTMTFGGHNWFCLTHNNWSQSLLFATS